MLSTVLPGTDIRISRFGFGTSSLLRSGTARQRARLLAAAYDYGFTHFDTAPYYGFGVAERDLRPLLAAHKDITVTSKVGLYAPGGEAQPTGLVFARKIAGRWLPILSKPIVDWSIARARDSLSASLRRLGRERVDFYLLHEPDPALIRSEEWLRWLEDERDRVRCFGLAVDAARLCKFVAANDPLLSFVQTEDSLRNREADTLIDSGRKLQITYGYIRDALSSGVTDIAGVLAAALARNGSGSILVGTSKIARLARYSKLADKAGVGAPPAVVA
jgi:aryl-alcohol dehydrogenase-like predicted oxidoreductase